MSEEEEKDTNEEKEQKYKKKNSGVTLPQDEYWDLMERAEDNKKY